MEEIFKGESFSCFIKLFNKKNKLCKLSSGQTLFLGIKDKIDIFSNNKYIYFKQLNNQDFIEGEGFLFLLLPEDTDIKTGIYYFDIGIQYIENNQQKYKFLQKTQILKIKERVTTPVREIISPLIPEEMM